MHVSTTRNCCLDVCGGVHAVGAILKLLHKKGGMVVVDNSVVQADDGGGVHRMGDTDMSSVQMVQIGMMG